MEVTTLLIAAVCVFLAALFLKRNRPYMIPPGPRLLPFLGNLHLFLVYKPLTLAAKLRKEYGDIYSIYIGSRVVIVICGLRLIKEAFVKEAHIFSDRPKELGFDDYIQGKGILMASGERWKIQRRFMITSFRDLGLGRNVMEARIIPEVRVLKEAMTHLNEASFCPHDLLLPLTTNIMLSVLMAKRLDWDDPQLAEIFNSLDRATKSYAQTSVLRLLPFLKLLPGDLFDLKVYEKTNDFVKAQIKERRANLNPDNITSFTEAYVLKIRQDADKNIPSDFYDENLLEILVELMVAGSETTVDTSEWLLLFLTLNQDVQDRVHHEIDTILGNSPPTYSDRLKLPYVEAAIMEAQRLADVVPFSIFHSASEDTMFEGYRITKGAIVIPSFASVMHDPQLFPEPDKFRPERFLNVDKKSLKDMGFIPFSLGKRSCPGESLARMEIFLLVTTIMQHFRLVFPEGYKIPSMEGNLGQTKKTPYYKVRAIPRAQK